MKNTILFFAILLSISFVSCSDYSSESDLITTPTIEKSSLGNPNSNFPYPVLLTFEKIKDVAFSRSEIDGAIVVVLKIDPIDYSDFYVTVDYQFLDLPKSLIYISNTGEGTFLLENVKPEYVSNVNVYGAKLSSITSEQLLPYNNGYGLNPLPFDGWKPVKENLYVYQKPQPYWVKFIFGEIKTKGGDYLIFLGKPKNEEFIIPEFNKFGVYDLKLYGYITPLEKNLASE